MKVVHPFDCWVQVAVKATSSSFLSVCHLWMVAFQIWWRFSDSATLEQT